MEASCNMGVGVGGIVNFVHIMESMWYNNCQDTQGRIVNPHSLYWDWLRYSLQMRLQKWVVRVVILATMVAI